jgi:iron complex outermembrane recepter protein
MQLALFGQQQETMYNPNIGGQELIDGRAMGFMDILDANGNVLYPAEAFLYGGRPSIQIPDNLPEYLIKPSNPEYQVGLNFSYDLPPQWGGWGITTSVSKRFGSWDIKLDATNLTNEHAYRPRQYNGSAGQLITAMPLARYNLTARFNFK